MLAIEVSINVFLLVGISLVFLILGMIFRNAKMELLKRKICELEQEILDNHAEILDLQSDKKHVRTFTNHDLTTPLYKQGKENPAISGVRSISQAT